MIRKKMSYQIMHEVNTDFMTIVNYLILTVSNYGELRKALQKKRHFFFVNTFSILGINKSFHEKERKMF